MTAILNKLVSACQTIEANAGSGGGSSGSSYPTELSVLNKSSFTDGYCYISLCGLSEKHSEAKIYIRVNDEAFDRYYIEAEYHSTFEKRECIKIFKSTSAPTDSTELSFALVNCSTSVGNLLCLKISGIDTITSDTFTVYNQYSYNGALVGAGISGFTEESTYDNTQFVPVTPSA